VLQALGEAIDSGSVLLDMQGCFLSFNILDYFCTTYFVFANPFWKFFSKYFLQIVKDI
jgi:hypothetical protein